MLVTRQYETEHSRWPFSRYEASLTSTSPRMSNPYDVNVELPAPTSWQAQNPTTSHSGSGPAQQHQSRNEASRLSLMRHPAENRGNALGIHMRPGATQITFVPPSRQTNDLSSTQSSQGARIDSPQDEEEDDLDDDDMLDGEAEHSAQTPAERAAARRKMKRFRLTHQQTRFLMSEFAKQPHPDAAHRERLSREIPGLSSRQVQVWFQNRRAKIKRLNADDRDRMIKMRAVPEGFDNVQALHSPYGAVHGMNAPMPSPGHFNTQSYAQHMIRPLIVDGRRHDTSEHASPTAMTPGFGGMGYSPAGSLTSSGLASPLSPAPSDRYPYGGHFTAPLTGSPRTSHPFAQHHGLGTPVEIHRSSPQPIPPPLLRDPLCRARSESSQSPLRPNMPWKGDAGDYSYRGTNTSPNLSDRHPSIYHPAPLSNPSIAMSGYDANSVPGSRAPPENQVHRTEI
ncbi:Homeobox-leucine zipper protein ROC3 [Fusarium oxysporum f. sp. cubense race 1]|uniref:Homeobox-leucine zipper protein ROC3 n=1 Tax=Fusarium oxysporum f. sp. cubense (strain race 1) TaxID=1229664 RepID=N4TZ60_FUSC1|nr:Homeobox-leucine zipper protein ROC3 [Fusarium oxysporum f. sp. cubense race 1]